MAKELLCNIEQTPCIEVWRNAESRSQGHYLRVECRRYSTQLGLWRACLPRISPRPDTHVKTIALAQLSYELPMESSGIQQRPRKRRAINACAICRTSKVRCDGGHPCQRCARNGTTCLYLDAVKDENILRIEKLEEEVATLRNELDNVLKRRNITLVDQKHISMMPHRVHGRYTASTAVDAGLFTWDQAALWFKRYWLLYFQLSCTC